MANAEFRNSGYLLPCPWLFATRLSTHATLRVRRPRILGGRPWRSSSANQGNRPRRQRKPTILTADLVLYRADSSNTRRVSQDPPSQTTDEALFTPNRAHLAENPHWGLIRTCFGIGGHPNLRAKTSGLCLNSPGMAHIMSSAGCGCAIWGPFGWGSCTGRGFCTTSRCPDVRSAQA